MKTENFVCVPITDLASTVDNIESKLYLARRSGQVAEVAKLELILLNLKNLSRAADIYASILRGSEI